MTPADRLRKVANWVEGLDPQLFDMDTWVRRLPQDSRPALVVLNEALQEPACGTAACFMGWATVIFPDQVSIEQVGIGYGPVDKVTGAAGSKAIENLFGLTRTEGVRLCNFGHYFDLGKVSIKEQVVARAREMADMVEERSK